MAYVLGFFAADGSMIRNNRGAHFIEFHIGDLDILRKIRSILNSNHKISKLTKKSNRYNSILESYRLQIGSKEIFCDLTELGFSAKKTYRLVVPEMPANCFSGFVRGYFDGDGSVWTGLIHKERQTKHLSIITVFTSGCGPFLDNLRSGLARNGIIGKVRCDKGFYRLSYSILGSIKLAEFMYKDCQNGLFLKRKKTIFDKYIHHRNKNAVVAQLG